MSGTGIVGVHSRSSLEPLKKTGFSVEYQAFNSATTYSDWVFAIR
jgi:hypothetical protein